MNLFTERILQYKPKRSISPQLLKLSQEYRVLATLKYINPIKYGSFIAGDAPDLQDPDNKTGIEVTAAVQERDMKISRLFAQLCEDDSNTYDKKLLSAIEKENYSVAKSEIGYIAVAPASTSVNEKQFIQNSIYRKLEKLPRYLCHYERVELAVILPEMPTKDAENNIIDWIMESLECKQPVFEYIHVVCHRFYLGIDINTGKKVNVHISKQENHSLSAIARMTAEGLITFDSEEWQ